MQQPFSSPLTPDDIDCMCGVGWEGELEAMRTDDLTDADS